MNNKKYMVLFILLFITLLSCAVITAADTTNNVTADKTVSTDTITQKAVQTDKSVKNINDEKTKTIEKKVEKNKKEAKQEVVANSYNDLYNYVEQAKTSDDEYVIKYTAYSGMDPTITNSIIWNPTTPKTLTINGKGTVDADTYTRFLTITEGNTVIINNLTIKNARSDIGAAITNHGTLILSDSVFENNVATSFGGAIYSDANLTVNRSTFTGNYMSTKDAFQKRLGGGAITSLGNLTIDNSTFTGNFARHVDEEPGGNGGYAGAIYVLNTTDDVTIINSYFTENNARHGGAITVYDLNIKNEGTVTIEGNKFYKNSALYGGAINSFHTITINNNNFTENFVTGEGSPINGVPRKAMGGALCLQTETGETHEIISTVTNNFFIGNEAKINGQGGAIKAQKDTTLNSEGNTYEANKAATGGVIQYTGYIVNTFREATFNNDVFTNNQANNGSIIYHNETVTLDACTINDNPAGDGGYLITSDNAKSLTLQNSLINYQGSNLANDNAQSVSFENNQYTTNVENYAQLLNLINTIKTSHSTDNIVANLTGTDYTETEPIVIDNTFLPELLTINGNGQTIDADGYQFLTIAQGKAVTINNLTVKDAKADIGAAVINHGTLVVSDSVFENNEAFSFGGAIYSDGNLTVTGSTFTGNFMSTQNAFNRRLGGGAITSLGKLTVDNSTFAGNFARHVDEEPGGNGGYAGAIYVLNTTDDVSIINSYFTQNNARHGGAIAVYDLNIKNEGTVIIEGNKFYKNSALYGGAINSFHTITINNNNFTENFVTGEGSPLADGTPRKAMGGALCLQTETGETHEIISTVTNNNFTGNEAKINGQGGAIKAQKDTTLNSENNTYEENKAATGGAIQYTGFIVNTFREATFNNDGFINNQANNGSVIYQNETVTLDECTIETNTVLSEGGYVITNDNAASLTLKDNIIYHTGADLVNTDVQTKTAEGNTFAEGNVVVTIAPISDVTIIDTEETTNIPVTLTIDSIYGITSMDDAQIKVTVNEDVQNAYQFPISGTESTIAIPVSDLSANNNVVVELVSDSGIYTLTPESLSFNIQKLITTQLSVNAANIYAGDNVNISGTLQKGDTGIDQKTIKLVINDVEYTTTTDANGYYEFTDLIINDVTSEVVVTAKFVETGYVESTATTSFAILERPSIISTSITVDAIEGDLHVEDKVTLTSYVKDALGNFVDGGFVIFKINGKTLRDDDGKVIYVQVDNGKAQLSDVEVTQEWAKEGSKIQAYYTGMDNYDISVSSPVSVSVVKNTAVVSVEATSGVAGQNITIKATVTSNGAPVPVGRVAIKIDGKTLKDANGKALYVSVAEIAQGVNYTLPTKIKEGTHTLSVVFTDPTFDRATDSATLTVSKEQT